jgi:hypothetical protein
MKVAVEIPQCEGGGGGVTFYTHFQGKISSEKRETVRRLCELFALYMFVGVFSPWRNECLTYHDEGNCPSLQVQMAAPIVDKKVENTTSSLVPTPFFHFSKYEGFDPINMLQGIIDMIIHGRLYFKERELHLS